MARKSAREQALTVVAEMDAATTRWAKEHDDALRELDRLAETLGEAALGDPAAAASAPRKMATFRDRGEVAARAVAAAQGKALAARRDAIRAEADELLPGIEQAQARLSAHEARTAGLLAALVAHAGEDYVAESDVPYDPRDVAVMGPREVGTPVRVQHTIGLAMLVRERAVLLAVADGRDPREDVPGIGLAGLPVSVRPGPDCLLPAPGFSVPVDEAAVHRGELAEVESRLSEASTIVDNLAATGMPGLEDARRVVERLTLEAANIRGYVVAGS